MISKKIATALILLTAVAYTYFNLHVLLPLINEKGLLLAIALDPGTSLLAIVFGIFLNAVLVIYVLHKTSK